MPIRPIYICKLIKSVSNIYLGLKAKNECQLCSPGFYCDQVGLNTTAGSCKEGYYCPLGSDSSEKVICPSGRYCPLQASLPTLCPEGTYQNSTGKWDASQCMNCTAGKHVFPCKFVLNVLVKNKLNSNYQISCHKQKYIAGSSGSAQNLSHKCHVEMLLKLVLESRTLQ